MGHRKTASLHIRFDGFKLIDRLEIWANRRGEKIVPWARKALLKQARAESFEEIIEQKTHQASIETLALVREMAGPEVSRRIHEDMKSNLSQVRSDVQNQFN